jgi:hypothetical protein
MNRGIIMVGTYPHNVSLASTPFFWEFRLQPLKSSDVQLKSRSDIDVNPHNWEVHYFWPMTPESVVIPAFEEEMYHAEAYQYKLYEDVYLLSPDVSRVLRVRNQELQIKQLLTTVDDVGAYAKKERHPLPHSLADEYFKTNATCFVLKESLRLKLKTFPHTKIEFSKLHLPNSKYISIGFEGKEFAEVATVHECLKLDVPPQTYAEFIRQLTSQKNS